MLYLWQSSLKLESLGFSPKTDYPSDVVPLLILLKFQKNWANHPSGMKTVWFSLNKKGIFQHPSLDRRAFFLHSGFMLKNYAGDMWVLQSGIFSFWTGKNSLSSHLFIYCSLFCHFLVIPMVLFNINFLVLPLSCKLTGFAIAIIPWNNPKKLEKPCITKGQYLGWFYHVTVGTYGGPRLINIAPETFCFNFFGARQVLGAWTLHS